MADSDDEYDRKRRDKFRGERSAGGDNYRSERRDDRSRGGGGGGRDDWQDRGRGRPDYRDYRQTRDRGYSPNNRDGPPIKRMRGDWDEGRPRYGGHEPPYGAYGGGGGWPHDHYQMHGHFGGHPPAAMHAAAARGAGVEPTLNPDVQTQPQMMTLKQFLATQDDSISDSDAITKYNEYKLEFKRQQLNEFFVAHKDEEWFKIKYHPEESSKRREEQLNYLKKRVEVFAELLEKGLVTGVTVDTTQTDQLLRLLDTVVIKLEDGTEEDLLALDEKPVEVKPIEPKIDVAKIDKKSDTEPEKEKSDDKPSDETEENTSDDTVKTNGEIDADKKPADAEKKKEPKKRKRSDSGSSSSGSSSSSSSDSEDDDEEKKKDDEKVEEKSPESPVEPISADNEDEEDEKKDAESLPIENVDSKENGEEKKKDVDDAIVEKMDTSEANTNKDDEKDDGEDDDDDEKEKEKKEKETLEDGEDKDKDDDDDDDKKADGEDKTETIDLDTEKDPKEDENVPRALHKTSSIFLRNLAPTITKPEVEAMCKKYNGFLRVAIADPLGERRWFRRGWVTFRRDVNIKEICWNLNNIRLRDCELGAIVNRDLSRRVRPVNGITTHKTIVRSDIKLCAKIAHNLDEKSGLWRDDKTTAELLEKVKIAITNETFGLNSKNPVLQNITDYLIEEASAEEDELLGLSGSENKESPDGENIERDPQLISVLDKLILYLRIVHSLDFYNHCEYPYEDEMPNRCGIIHARGPQPQKVTNNEIQDYIRNFETKMSSFLAKSVALEIDELKKLGSKDSESEVEKFVLANTQELSKDKWLCPLSGKKFKGPDFIRKHIFNKHDEKVDEVRKEVEYFNNYLKDAKRPQLPEHPGSNKKPIEMSPGGGFRPGYPPQGYIPPYAQYVQPTIIAPPRPRPGGYGGPRRDIMPNNEQRRIIPYHDLDAVDNSDIFA